MSDNSLSPVTCRIVSFMKQAPASFLPRHDISFWLCSPPLCSSFFSRRSFSGFYVLVTLQCLGYLWFLAMPTTFHHSIDFSFVASTLIRDSVVRNWFLQNHVVLCIESVVLCYSATELYTAYSLLNGHLYLIFKVSSWSSSVSSFIHFQCWIVRVKLRTGANILNWEESRSIL